FNEAVSAGSVSFTVKDAANNSVAGVTSYTASTRTVTFRPSASLAPSATYTAAVSGATDLYGHVQASPTTWSFTTVVPNCPCTLWPSSASPAVASANDSGAVELGVKFRSDINGVITGVRFYKGVANTGTHIGNLWTLNGTLLATVTFTGE